MRLAITVIGALLTCATARAGMVVVDQPPNQFGGSASDTSFYNEFGEERWQYLADDILLTQPATIRRIVWHGFYGNSSKNFPEPLPASETMRIRFYDARPGDGLPGNVLFEEMFQNPSRTATGNVIFTGPAPPEQRYEVDLSTPYGLQANTPYWLEIAQLGDPVSHFRWETSPGTGTPYVFKSIAFPDWRPSGAVSNLALELSTIPEPSCLVWLVGALCVFRWRARRVGRMSSQRS